MPDILETLDIITGPEPQAAVIWMHGLGADAHDFEPAVPALAPGTDVPVRFVFPDAPRLPVTINGGAVMPAWYDIVGFGDAAPQDLQGIRSSAAAIEQLIGREQARGIPAERIVLAGFSQGGAMALHTALRFSARLAGVVALSCYLPVSDTFAAEAQPANAATPVFMAHGEYDPVVDPRRGQASMALLRAAGYPVRWHTYPMPHSVVVEELADVREFLIEVLSPPVT